MPTVVSGDFEWDEDKAEANFAKHRVSFDEAATALLDPRLVVFDEDSLCVLKAVGTAHRGRLLTVAHTIRGDRERIISAWASTPEERRHWVKGW